MSTSSDDFSPNTETRNLFGLLLCRFSQKYICTQMADAAKDVVTFYVNECDKRNELFSPDS